MTRGPLPPEVYWRRRFFVVALALTLVFVIGSALSGGNDAEDEEPAAQQAAATHPTSTVTVGGEKARQRKQRQTGPIQGPTAPSTELVEPDGPCKDSDVVVTPVVEEAVGGQDVTVGLQLQTREAAACTWQVDRDSVAVKILDGSTEIWTSRECPGALPRESVVVRWAVATVVEMTWADARESDRECSDQADWVMPGDYTIVAAALGGEPSEATFDLVSPSEATSSPTGESTSEAPESGDPEKSEQPEQSEQTEKSEQPGKKTTERAKKSEKQRDEERDAEPRR